jgi:hypothetical protein
MFGLFKKKNADGCCKLPGPRGVPDPVGSSLVVQHKEDPNWAWALKAVLKPKAEKGIFEIRVFSDQTAIAAKVSVKDFNSLDGHPDLILYDGIYDKGKKKAHLQVRYK